MTALLVTIAFLVGGVGAWAAWRYHLIAQLVERLTREVRAYRRRTGTHTRYPVVLAHGFMGFDAIDLGDARHEYFRGVAGHLRRLGSQVHTGSVPAIGSIAERAEHLARAVRSIEAPRVNIIAHSMGGLDARYAITRLGLGKKVASLTTIGTPHHGTPLADASNRLVGGLLTRLGVEMTAVGDLTTEKMRLFNDEVANVPGVAYGCVLASVRGGVRGLNTLLVPTYLFLNDRSGPNDGVVPTQSQRWGEVLLEVDADHWAQIGWSKSFDALDLYRSLLLELRSRGF